MRTKTTVTRPRASRFLRARRHPQCGSKPVASDTSQLIAVRLEVTTCDAQQQRHPAEVTIGERLQLMRIMGQEAKSIANGMQVCMKIADKLGREKPSLGNHLLVIETLKAEQ